MSDIFKIRYSVLQHVYISEKPIKPMDFCGNRGVLIGTFCDAVPLHPLVPKSITLLIPYFIA